jgi:hypothetical protein
MTRELKATETAITAIEAANNSGMRLIPNGDRISVDKTGCDAEQLETIMALLRRNKDSIVALTSSQSTAKQVLANARKAIVDADKYVHDHMDLWFRLETIYRSLWDDKACISGEAQCGAIHAEIIRCTACEEKA